MVRIVGVDGQPFRYESRVVVTWFTSTTSATRSERDLPEGTPTTEFEAPAGARATVTVLACGKWTEPAAVAGTAADSRRTECVVRIDHEPIRVVARVVSSVGTESAPSKLLLRARTTYAPPSPRLFPQKLATQSEAVEVEVREGGSLLCDLPSTLVANRHDQVEIGWRDVRAVVPVGHPLTIARHDLGEVRTAKTIEIASGTVLDAAKRPVLAPAFSLRDADTGAWIDPRDFTVTKHERGRFAISGWTTAKRVELVVMHDEHAPSEPATVATGTKDLTIALPDSGAVALSCGTTAGTLPDTLELWLEGPGSTTVRVATNVSRADGGSLRVQWRGLLPGSYALRGRAAQDRPARDLIQGVTVRAKAPSDDPRLVNLDLKDLVDTKG